tara:strand:- start:797 stop:1099 length:303 start_codon:yes stop_codon:yes gene_type:complete
MLIDIRIYQTKPATRETHFELYEKYGRAPQTRILGEPYSYVKSIEDPNEFILMWSYEDLADREAKRELMWKDPEWQVYVTHSKALGAVVSQYNKLVEILE